MEAIHPFQFCPNNWITTLKNNDARLIKKKSREACFRNFPAGRLLKNRLLPGRIELSGKLDFTGDDRS